MNKQVKKSAGKDINMADEAEQVAERGNLSKPYRIIENGK